jgi:hypothetical protein
MSLNIGEQLNKTYMLALLILALRIFKYFAY